MSTICFSKLISHPDKDEIISKLVSGINPKDVSDWLKMAYPDKEQSHLRLTAKLLKDFTNNNLDLYSAMRNDVNDLKSGQEIAKQTSQSLLNNKTYQERLNEVADKEIDIKKSITNTMHLISARLEQVYDKIQENPMNMKPDYALIKWFELLLTAQERWHKINVEPVDTVINQNITVNMVEQHSAVLQDAVRETLAELDPEIAFLFMDKLNKKLETLKPESEKPLTQDQKLKEVQVLEAKFEKQEETVDE